MDVDLLSLLRDRSVFSRINAHIDPTCLSKEAQTIYHTIVDFYKEHSTAAGFTWDEMATYFNIKKSKALSVETRSIYTTIFGNLKTYTTSATQAELLDHYIRQDYVDRIAQQLEEVRAGTSTTLAGVESALRDYNAAHARALVPTDMFVDPDLSAVVAAARGPGLSWRLPELNISLGPLRKGDFVILAARPEVGKTTFLADNVSYMAEQLKEGNVVWVNNEERSDKVFLRVVQACLGWKIEDIEKDTAAAVAEYTKRMSGHQHRILITKNDSRYNNARYLDTVFASMQPKLIVIDQLDKVSGFSSGKGERDDLRLGALYLWGRNLAHAYGPVITASQADASAEGLQWLDQSMLRGSKTDKPGEADAIIAIGVNNLHPNMRYISVLKNKLHGGPPPFDERERHGKWEVQIKPTIARYEGTR